MPWFLNSDYTYLYLLGLGKIVLIERVLKKAASIVLNQFFTLSKSFYPKPTTGSGTTYVTTKAEPEEEDEDEELSVNHGDGPLKSYSKVIY